MTNQPPGPRGNEQPTLWDTDMTKNNPPRKYELDCGHCVWYRVAPNVGDNVYCADCRAYVAVGPTFSDGSTTYYDTWSCQRKPGHARLVGTCMTCGYEYAKADFYAVRTNLDHHYLRAHTNSRLTFTREPQPVPSPLPRDAPF